MSAHPVTWLAPRPLWRGLDPSLSRRPSILRFTSDDFMEELLRLLAEDPSLLGERLVAPETWRDGTAAHPVTPRPPRLPLPGPLRQARLARQLATAAVVPPRPAAIKLYQPAHGRHYVAVASLACGIPGLPERSFTPGGPEAVGFVLRRLLPRAADPGDLAEFAWIPAAEGPRWRLVAAQGDGSERLSPGEELLPVFPLPHGDQDGPRTLWGGLVPVGRREDYVAAPVDRKPIPLPAGQVAALRSGMEAAGPAEARITARLTRFKSEVAEPWKALIRASHIAAAELGASVGESPDHKRSRAVVLNVAWAGQAWLILLDFALWLKGNLPEVMAALRGGPRPSRPAEATLYDRLTQVRLPALPTAPNDPMIPGKPLLATLGAALEQVGAFKDGLEAAQGTYSLGHQDEAGLPPWHFPLVAIDALLMQAGASTHFTESPEAPAYDAEVERDPAAPAAPSHLRAAQAAEKLDLLTVLVARALTPADESGEPPLPFALTMRNAIEQTRGDAGQFVLRFVHLNADCGPIHPPTLSEPTAPFALAHFFDVDAPARPIRITLPLDTSPAALRKYPRNTAFVMSDMLCGQVQRAKGLGLVDLIRHVLPFPLHKPLDLGAGGSCKDSGGTDIGMICSLSIPIITICALILLMLIVALLDFIFRWIPYFIMCFPVRGLKGKRP